MAIRKRPRKSYDQAAREGGRKGDGYDRFRKGGSHSGFAQAIAAAGRAPSSKKSSSKRRSGPSDVAALFGGGKKHDTYGRSALDEMHAIRTATRSPGGPGVAEILDYMGSGPRGAAKQAAGWRADGLGHSHDGAGVGGAGGGGAVGGGGGLGGSTPPPPPTDFQSVKVPTLEAPKVDINSIQSAFKNGAADVMRQQGAAQDELAKIRWQSTASANQGQADQQAQLAMMADMLKSQGQQTQQTIAQAPGAATADLRAQGVDPSLVNGLAAQTQSNAADASMMSQAAQAQMAMQQMAADQSARTDLSGVEAMNNTASGVLTNQGMGLQSELATKRTDALTQAYQQQALWNRETDQMNYENQVNAQNQEYDRNTAEGDRQWQREQMLMQQGFDQQQAAQQQAAGDWDMQQQKLAMAADMLGALPGGGRSFDRRGAANSAIDRYGEATGKDGMADDILRQVLSQSDSEEDAVENLYSRLQAENETGKTKKWDVQGWFMPIIRDYFKTGSNLTPDAKSQLERYGLSGLF